MPLVIDQLRELDHNPSATSMEYLALALSRQLSKVVSVELWGEQPDGQALPADGALRGDVPLSSPSESEVQ